ncbi:uncharacterized protein [Blastocystis hominis]|uniref:Vacuolar protein sorting-associated protein 54 C-terminal domain-containing protein n=1 Tax=Blastocystis hominis TaxID=12968 RepID=D8LWT5_BLAHO|nr:uncharacterized protein [Blastocystis hominis]CBK20274.2 unnamed protein product [Blastocystis hominis]|eukprot:XP_012894322.1 uncharacterized protein [Blastocystis hominis]
MTICLGPESLTNPVILRQLPHKDFVTTLDVLCEQFLKSAQRSRRVVAVCLNILATIPNKQDNTKSSSVDDILGVEDVLAITDAERTALQQHLQTLHTSTWSRMQQHISTMLDARSEIHSQLQIDELKQVWDHCMDFVSVAGRIYNTKGMLLLHTLLRQARDSLEYLHKSQLLMLQNLLHEELWKPALVPSALQNELTHLQENPRTAALLVRTSTTDVISAHPRLLIGSQSFCVTHSMLEFVKMLLHYLLYARSFQGLGPEVMHRILELFRTFNTSSRSLVLNAGAVSQGFLKRISARHIALVTQCLSAAMSLVTVAQTSLVLYLPSKQHPVLMQLSQGMIELFADHRSQLFEKFPEIIKSVAEKSCSNLEVV